MTSLPPGLQQILADDPAILEVMGAYSELERIYEGALQAMGLEQRRTASVRSSADVRLSFSQNSSTLAVRPSPSR